MVCIVMSIHWGSGPFIRSQAGGGAHCSCPESGAHARPLTHLPLATERRAAAERMAASLRQGWQINWRIRGPLRHSDAIGNSMNSSKL